MSSLFPPLKTHARLIASISLSVFVCLVIVYSAAMATTSLIPGTGLGTGLQVDGQAIINNSGSLSNGLIVEKGNVGIGTTAPVSKLSVGGAGINNAGIYGTGSMYGVYGEGGENGVFGSGTNYGVYGSGPTGVWASGINFGVYAYNGTSGGTGLYSYAPANGYAVYASNGKNYFDGNVGIGTTNPATKLFVNGAIGGVTTKTYGGIDVWGKKNGYSGIAFFDSAGTYESTFMVDADGATGMYKEGTGWQWYFNSAGNLDVGTVSTAGTLSGVQKNGPYSGSTAGSYYHLGSWGGNGWGPDVLVERARYADIAGDVPAVAKALNQGVNTYSMPTFYRVTISDTTSMGSTANNYLPAGGNWNYTLVLNGSNETSIGFHDAGASVSSIRYNNGGFVIGEDNGWGVKDTYIVGNLRGGKTSTGWALGSGAWSPDNWLRLTTSAGGGTYHDLAINQLYSAGAVRFSDRRAKKDIETVDNALSKVNALRGVTYKWKDPAVGSGGVQMGVVAQEVEEVLPDLVKVGANGLKGVEYDQLTGLFIEAIKEQQKEIEKLKNINKDLEQRLTILENN